jgi:hypothetical protein
MLNEFSKKEAPIHGLAGLGGGVPSRLLTLASGEITYVDDVFSTTVYKGTGSTAQTINNGIDLSGEGGMVWIKDRDAANSHAIYDTERGVQKLLKANDDHAEDSSSSGTTDLYQFNNNGFAIGSDNSAYLNTNNNSHCSWTFRKCPGFFDIVTYTGTPGSPLTVNHNLGSVPGCIMIKNLSSATGWAVYHRGANGGNAPYNKKLVLNTTAAQADDNWWNNAAPTDTSFQLSGDPSVNSGGSNYVAYLFAHNDGSFGEDSDEAVIKCDYYTGTGSTGLSVNLGFEPQWLMIKRVDSTEDWHIFDNMRGVVSGGNDYPLKANLNYNESTSGVSDYLSFTPTGFQLDSTSSPVGGNGGTYIYIAIRRPHKPPEDATDVFDVFSDAGSGSTELRPGTSGSGVTDVAVIKRTESSRNPFIGYRILGQKSLALHTDAAATTGPLGSTNAWDQMQGLELEVDDDTNVSGGTFLNYYFTRAPGFMDVVTYTGNGSAGRTISHNLGVAPELMILTGHDFDQEWVWLVNKGSGYSGQGNGNSSFDTPSAAKFGNGSSYVAPTATSFTVGNDNATNGDTSKNYIALMFGSVEGISKVGTYTGTGSQLDIDCGFTGNARFVIIRHLSGGGHFMWFDTVQGIVSGNDQHWRSNTTANPVSHTDYIDPYTGGFSLPASDSNANASGSTYLFFAIA